MTDQEHTGPRYKASYRWVREGRFGQRRSQEWFVKDTTTGDIVSEHFMWSRADAEFEAKKLNKGHGYES